jgi:hypothetical protein
MSQRGVLHKAHVQALLDFLQFDQALRHKIQAEVKEQLQDILQSRITEEATCTGEEVIDSLGDVPDVIEGVMDHELEHQRDIAMVLIKDVFAQARSKSQTIELAVSELENEARLKLCHDFCQELLTDPEKVLAAAPDAPEEVLRSAQAARSPKSGAAAKLMEENARLRAEIEAGLQGFPQYGKTVEMVRERDVEIRGLKARL